MLSPLPVGGRFAIGGYGGGSSLSGASKVEVQVKNGEVTLTGTVDRREKCPALHS